MNDQLKYDPEDIESLLMHKQFHELYEEERQFVLQHLGSEEEYESLRKTLFELHNVSAKEQWLEPDPSIRKALLAEFASEEKGGFKIWLNSLFNGISLDWMRRPAFGVAFATACIAGAVVLLITNRSEEKNIAQVNTDSAPAISEQPMDSVTESTKLFSENLTSTSLPPAPVQIAEPALDAFPNEVKSVQFQDNMMAEENAEPADYSEDMSQVSTSNGPPAERAPVATNEVKSLSDNAADISTKKTEDVEKVAQAKTQTIEKLATLSEVQTTSAGAASYYNDRQFEEADLARIMITDPAVAPASQVRDVFDLLFTAK
jgi:hypothetical protein